MTTKVQIIEIDLGIDVKDIINQGVVELSGEAKKNLDTAIATAKATKRLKEKKEQEKTNHTNALQVAMQTAYDKLMATQVGVPVTDIMAIITPHVPNSSAFTLRMKKMLQNKGNKYIIERKKMQGTPYYIFTPFNQETTEDLAP